MSRLLHIFLAAWLVLALPLGQHEALLHALGHATQGSAGDGVPAPEKCPDHSLYTPFAAGVGCSSLFVAAIAAGSPITADAGTTPAAASPRHHYHSRAPPASPARR